MPVPASKMMRRPPQATSTQLVLPPNMMYFADGQAMLPRTPPELKLEAHPRPARVVLLARRSLHSVRATARDMAESAGKLP
jgi:hypothetical protein